MSIHKKFLSPIIQALLWFFIYVIFSLVDNSHYLFEWIIHNKVFYIAVALIAVLITFLQKNIGYSITLGNICGLFLGRFMGDYIRNQSMLKITEDMSAQKKYELSQDYGVFIWIECILASIIISLIIELIKKIIKKVRRNVS